MKFSSGYIYAACGIIFLSSFAAVRVLPIDDAFRGVASFPGSLALFGILYRLWRDEREHERKMELQDRQNDFALGTASHMATIAYDKHVVFCEEYMARVQSGFQELLRDGPNKKAMNIGGDLVRIRMKHVAWLTTDMENKLKPFEMAVIKIGAQQELLENGGAGQQRAKVVDEIFKSFGLILGHNTPTTEEESLIALQEPIQQIRKILGIDALMALRLGAAEAAFARVE